MKRLDPDEAALSAPATADEAKGAPPATKEQISTIAGASKESRADIVSGIHDLWTTIAAGTDAPVVDKPNGAAAETKPAVNGANGKTAAPAKVAPIATETVEEEAVPAAVPAEADEANGEAAVGDEAAEEDPDGAEEGDDPEFDEQALLAQYESEEISGLRFVKGRLGKELGDERREKAALQKENAELRQRLDRIEQRLAGGRPAPSEEEDDADETDAADEGEDPAEALLRDPKKLIREEVRREREASAKRQEAAELKRRQVAAPKTAMRVFAEKYKKHIPDPTKFQQSDDGVALQQLVDNDPVLGAALYQHMKSGNSRGIFEVVDRAYSYILQQKATASASAASNGERERIRARKAPTKEPARSPRPPALGGGVGPSKTDIVHKPGQAWREIAGMPPPR